jgi:hypothetical protein
VSEPVDRRDAAVHVVDRTCPHCGAHREADQRYCLECGRPLPETTGRIPALRRRWLRRFDWYPGDWIWLPLALLVVAAAGAAVAATVAHHRRDARPQVITAISATPVAQPRAPAPNTATKGGWPAGRSGWTVVLVSYPQSGGQGRPTKTAADARRAHLPQVGVLDSSGYASLQPGYFVVFSGIYGSETDASNALPQAREAGFGAAYARQISG